MLLLTVLMVLWTTLLLLVLLNVKNDREDIGKIIEKMNQIYMFSIDQYQLLESRGMVSVTKCLNNLSKRNLIKLFWIVKNNTALDYNLK